MWFINIVLMSVVERGLIRFDLITNEFEKIGGLREIDSLDPPVMVMRYNG